jgi:hypothetical protein
VEILFFPVGVPGSGHQSNDLADGRDWREVYQECAEAQKFADGLGLNLAVGAIPPTQQQDLVAAQPINRMGIIA